MTKRLIKLFGERNTGTRAISQMLRQAEAVRQRVHPFVPPPRMDPTLETAIRTELKGGWRRHYLQELRDTQQGDINPDDQWKHACPVLTQRLVSERVTTFFAVRDPYSWALALARRPYHIKGPKVRSFEAFLRRPWMTEARENAPSLLVSPVALWSTKLSAYKCYISQAVDQGLSCEIIQFERFVLEPTDVLHSALANVGFQPRKPLQAVEYTKKDGQTLEDRQEYYRAETWRECLTAENVDMINDQVDWDLAQAFGYIPLSAADFPATRSDRAEALLAAGLARGSDRKTGAAAAA